MGEVTSPQDLFRGGLGRRCARADHRRHRLGGIQQRLWRQVSVALRHANLGMPEKPLDHIERCTLRQTVQQILQLQRIGCEIVELVFDAAAVDAEINRVGPVPLAQRAQVGTSCAGGNPNTSS